MDHITKIGKLTYWCYECEVYLLSEAAMLRHVKLHMSGIDRHWQEQEHGDAADRELMKLMGIRWP